MKEVLRMTGRVLTFRASREEFLTLTGKHLALGLVATWLAGIGRYWDDPGAHWGQHLGLGSIAYVFVISGFLWLLLKPMLPENWSYRRLLTFITLVSPPALLYAIPVERFLSLSAARTINVWFLAVVASWRVALLFFYLVRVASFRWYQVVVSGLLPLVVIVTGLTALNLERAIFDVMAGMRPDSGTANDAAYGVLFALTLLSMTAAPFLLVGYAAFIVLAQIRRRKQREAQALAVRSAVSGVQGEQVRR